LKIIPKNTTGGTIMTRRIIAVAAVIILAAVGVVGGTLAWFTDEETANNQFTTGIVDVELYENGVKISDDEGITIADFMPGDIEFKAVTVKPAAGSSVAWVRAKPEFDWQNDDLNKDPTAMLEIRYNHWNWQYNKNDGWYYFMFPIKPGGIALSKDIEYIDPDTVATKDASGMYVAFSETTPLFYSIMLKQAAGNEYADQNLTVKITVQAVQADNNWDGFNPMYVQGWPND